MTPNWRRTSASTLTWIALRETFTAKDGTLPRTLERFLDDDGTLLCQDVPQENCPDHGPAVAGAAAAIMAKVYGAKQGCGEPSSDHLGRS
jgi:hypothetical protein